MSDYSDAQRLEDTKHLQDMGYAQELPRRMGPFQNFAISFAIICIVAGGITAFPVALSAGGGASIGFGWPIACAFALLVATALGQIASAYPTAGGIYHWSSILGGRGWGWAAAWFNLLGLIFVVSSVNMGVFLLFRDLFLTQVLGWDVAAKGWVSAAAFDQGWWTQTSFIAAITLVQVILNHYLLRLTTILTDISGYLILATAALLTVSLLAFAPPLNFARLFTFTNFTGDAGGGVWPAATSSLYVLGIGLLYGVYTVTGFDASAHTSEETRNAPREVPKGMIRSVFWSFLVGYIMVCAFVLALPDQKDAAGAVVDGVTHGAKQGWGSFNWLMSSSAMPAWLKAVIITGIVISNFLCALAGLTSTSRMMYAFARDGGLPMSDTLKQVSPTFQTPGAAVWVAGILSVLATLYGGAFLVLSTGCAVFLYISYLMPIAAGMRAEMGGEWSQKGPFSLGGLSVLVSILAIIGCAVLIFVGFQPPQEKVMYLTIVMVLGLAALWQVMEGRNGLGWALALVTIAAVYWCIAGFNFSGGGSFLGLGSEGIIWMGLATVAMLVLTALLGNKRFAGPPTGDAIAKRATSAVAGARA
jgi:amino acid transporter